MTTGRERIKAACAGEVLDKPPVWIMRQAGRYLPEYMELRKRHGFWDFLRTPKLALEVAKQPLRRFDMDATILFSDILVILDAMGGQVRYGDGGPTLEHPFTVRSDLTRVRGVNVARDLDYVGEGLSLLRSAFDDKAVIGFAGAPLTLAAYFVGGRHTPDLRHLKSMAYNEPEVTAQLLDGIADAVADLLLMQIEAGADMIQLFDSWSGALSPEDYRQLALPAVKRVFDKLSHTDVPKCLYIRGAASHLEAAASSGCDVLSVDMSLSLADARARLGSSMTLQGNLDPAELFGPHRRIRSQVERLVFDGGPEGLILNLGQGVTPDIPVEGVHAFVDAVHEVELLDESA